MNNIACLYTDYSVPPQPVLALRYSRKMMSLAGGNGAAAANQLDTHGWALVLNGRIDEGLEILRASVARQDMAETHCHIAMARLKQGRRDDARAELDTAKRMLAADKSAGKPVEARVESRVNTAIDELNPPSKSPAWPFPFSILDVQKS